MSASDFDYPAFVRAVWTPNTHGTHSTGAPLPVGMFWVQNAPTLCCGVNGHQGAVLQAGTRGQGESYTASFSADDLLVVGLQRKTFRKKGVCVTFKLRRQHGRSCESVLYHVHLRRKPAKDNENEARIRALVTGMRVAARVHGWGVSGLVLNPTGTGFAKGGLSIVNERSCLPLFFSIHSHSKRLL